MLVCKYINLEIAVSKSTKNKIMKLLYYFLLLFVVLLGGYLFINNFSFDNESFSGFLLNTLFIFLLACVAILTVVLLVLAIKRKSVHKGIMTIQEYYRYKEYNAD